MEQLRVETIEAGYGRMTRRENGIIYFYMKDDLSVDLPVAQQAVADVCTLDDSGQARLLIVLSHNNDIQFEAQRFFGTAQGVTKLAMVINSRLQAEVAKFLVSMLQLFRSPYEMRPFHAVDEAEQWLLNE